MKKLIVKNGLIAGVITSGMVVLMFSGTEIDFKYGELFGYSSMIIAFSTIFFAVRSYRDKQDDRSISFGKALQIGLGITLVASALYVISWMILSNTIAKDFMSEYFQHSIEQLRASDLSEIEINKKIAEMEDFKELYKNPLVKIGMTFLEIFPVGLVISLLSAFVLKRTPEQAKAS